MRIILALFLFISGCKDSSWQKDGFEPRGGESKGEQGPGEIEKAPGAPSTPRVEIVPPSVTPQAAPRGPGAGFPPGNFGGHGHSDTGVRYKQGSQGKHNPSDTGNVDEKPAAVAKGVCGNDIVEVSPQSQAKCPNLIYAVGADNKLYTVNPTNGAVAQLADIIGLSNIRAIDFDSQGTLYAIAGSDPNQTLYTLDCSLEGTIEAVSVGLLTPQPDNISDITFDAFGRFWALTGDDPLNDDDLILINPFNGATTAPFASVSNLALFATPINNAAIFSAEFNVNELEPFGPVPPIGSSLDEDPITFPQPGFFVTDADVDYFNDKNYVIERNNGTVFVSLLKRSNGAYATERLSPDNPAPNLVGIAVNRVFEECDDAVPDEFLPGTDCINCQLVETDCADFDDGPADGIDNDLNGFANCADAACLNQECPDIDDEFCTIALCTEVGPFAEACEQDAADRICPDTDGNDCTIGFCDPEEGEEGACVIVPAAEGTKCDDNPNSQRDHHHHHHDNCIVGTCRTIDEDPLVVECVDTPRELVSDEEGLGFEEGEGCDDGNVCTADSCFDKKHHKDKKHSDDDDCEERSFECHYESLNGEVCLSAVSPIGEGICLDTVVENPEDPDEDIVDIACFPFIAPPGVVFVTDFETNGNITAPPP